MAENVKRIVFVGVGGQGNLLASSLLGQAALEAGLQVMVSEIHGMAQRGGVVESAVLIGGPVSPVVSTGEADVLVAFEPVEALRTLEKCGPDSVVVMSTRPLPPFTVATGQASYPEPSLAVKLIGEKVAKVVAFDGQSLAEEAKNPLSLNMVMLGALLAVGGLPVPREAVEEMIQRHTKPKFVAANLAAFSLGFEAAGRA